MRFDECTSSELVLICLKTNRWLTRSLINYAWYEVLLLRLDYLMSARCVWSCSATCSPQDNTGDWDSVVGSIDRVRPKVQLHPFVLSRPLHLADWAGDWPHGPQGQICKRCRR